MAQVNNPTKSAKNQSESNSVVRRIRKRKHFTTFTNDFLQNSAMSFEARGLLAMMLSLPDDWVFRVNWLLKQSPNTKIDRLRRLMKELALFGYLRRSRVHIGRGRFEWEYLLSESPFDFAPEAVLPSTEKPSMVNPSMENPSIYKEPKEESKQKTKNSQKGEGATTTTDKETGGGGSPSSSSFAKGKQPKEDSPLVRALADFLAEHCGAKDQYFSSDAMILRTARALGTRYDSVMAFKNDQQPTVDYIVECRPGLSAVRELFGLDRS